jgi:hypothetical protein
MVAVSVYAKINRATLPGDVVRFHIHDVVGQDLEITIKANQIESEDIS